jgi:SAM-dependent methyltransferase
VTRDERRLAATFPFVRDHLPSAPATVVEIGCGSLGGFVPALRREGYDAVGVDPRAPEERGYSRVEFEHHQLPRSVDAVVACTSLHHVADLDQIADRVREALVPGGVLVVVEWAWERFDEPSARWCFARLDPTAVATDPGWLHRRRDEWAASDEGWERYWRDWANGAHLHPSREILDRLEARFDRVVLADGPYLFPELDGVTAQDEQAAIDAAQVRATCVRYAGIAPG